MNRSTPEVMPRTGTVDGKLYAAFVKETAEIERAVYYRREADNFQRLARESVDNELRRILFKIAEEYENEANNLNRR